MTQEEIQQKAYEVYPLDLDRHLIIEGEPYDNNKEKREAYIRGLTDSKPSFPSNLDEAAITQMEEDGDIDHFVRKGIYEIALKYARLGAEWMEAHGFSFEDEVIFDGKIPFLKDADFDLLDSTVHFREGDKVIVQIRKK